MSLREDIRNAYDTVHAPDDVIERMKHELREKDLRGDAEQMICRAEEAPRPQIGRYLVYIAAVLTVCCGAGMAWKNVQEHRVELHPGSAVQQTAPQVQEGIVPDVTGMSAEQAVKLLEQANYTVTVVDASGGNQTTQTVPPYSYEVTYDTDWIVLRTEPAAGAPSSAYSITVFIGKDHE